MLRILLFLSGCCLKTEVFKQLYSFLGPGLLESTSQTCLQYELTQQGIFVEFQYTAF
ncbi:MAG: GxxExxY protein [Spirochaetaceae bacterium]|nr:GxxExxY protein [Spirochaetaceae bacterium]